jgi:ribosomal protein S24E
VPLKYIAELVAAAPELVVINCQGKIVGGLRNKVLEALYNQKEPTYQIYERAYDIIRQWALDR